MKITVEIDIPELDAFQTKAEQIAAIEGQIKALIQTSETPINSTPGTLVHLLAQAQTVKTDTPDHLPVIVKNAYAEAVKYFVGMRLSNLFTQQHDRIQALTKTYSRYLNHAIVSPQGVEANFRTVERYLGQGIVDRLRQQAQAEAQTIIDTLETEKE